MTLKEAYMVLASEGVAKKKIINFLKWLKLNPHIYKAFEEETFKAVQNGEKYLSAKEIWERLRRTRSATAQSEFKLSNNYTPYFARIYSAKWPVYGNVFKKKRVS